MAIHEYECECGHRMDVWFVPSPPKNKKCPICGRRMKKIISKSSFILKGNGWAKDGYRGGK